MGIAVTFVMVLASAFTYAVYDWVLVPLGMEFMQTIVFIFVIAALVQMLEMILKKFTPTLYSALGIYLPLVTTNCAILGIAETVIATATAESAHFALKDVLFGKFVEIYMANSYGEAVLSGLFYGLGFTLAIVIMAGLRQKVDNLQVAKPLRGFPMSMITACFMAMAFYIFTLVG